MGSGLLLTVYVRIHLKMSEIIREKNSFESVLSKVYVQNCLKSFEVNVYNVH